MAQRDAFTSFQRQPYGVSKLPNPDWYSRMGLLTPPQDIRSLNPSARHPSRIRPVEGSRNLELVLVSRDTFLHVYPLNLYCVSPVDADFPKVFVHTAQRARPPGPDMTAQAVGFESSISTAFTFLRPTHLCGFSRLQCLVCFLVDIGRSFLGL